jgi:hypothetical protein
MGDEDSSDFIFSETGRIPYKQCTPRVSDWEQAFRSWPTFMSEWADWYVRISKVKSADWEELGIGHCIGLSVLDIPKREPVLSAMAYFWSDALNAFCFGHGIQTVTLLDTHMLTALDVAQSSNPNLLMFKPHHLLQKGKKARGWKNYIAAYNPGKGPITDLEHVAFLNMWLDRFFFCGASVGPTDNYLYIAEGLSQKQRFPLGRYLLGALYRTLHQSALKLRRSETITSGGPWWFLQLWSNLYLSKLNKMEPFTDYGCTAFPPREVDDSDDADLRRCTSIGEVVTNMDPLKNDRERLADWFATFYVGIDSTNLIWCPYLDHLNEFEIPFTMTMDDPLCDD